MLKRILLLLVLLLAACDTINNEQDSLPTMMLLPTSTLAVNTLDFWQASGSTISTDQPDTWLFEGQRGDNIMVRAIGREFELSMHLVNVSGQIMVTGSNTVQAILPESGTYSVVVSSQTAGNYEIGLSYSDQPNPSEVAPTPIPEVVGIPTPAPLCSVLEQYTYISRLEDEETIGGTLEDNAASHLYIFEGTAGEYVELEMSRVSGEIDPTITLYDPDCVSIATDDDTGGNLAALLRNVRLPADGLYSLRVDGKQQGGGYSIRLLKYAQFVPVTPTLALPPTATVIPTFTVPILLPAVPGNRLENHVPVTAALSSPTDVARYAFYAASGEVVTIGAAPAEGSLLRPGLEVVNPDGIVIASILSSSSNAEGDALIPNLRIEVEGVHTIFVRSEASTLGQYIIGYGVGSSWSEHYQGEARFGEVYNGNIARRASRDLWTLHLQQGDIITASVNPLPNSPLNPMIELVRASEPDTPVAVDDDGGGGFSALLSNLHIQHTDLYVLRVRAADAGSTGGYNLIWRYVNTAPTPTTPPALLPVLTVNDTIGENEYKFYPFQGRAGQRIIVQVIAAADSDLDPVAALIGINGNVLADADDTGSDLNPRFEFTLPADGTYNVRVNGYLSDGAYTLTVQEVF